MCYQVAAAAARSPEQSGRLLATQALPLTLPEQGQDGGLADVRTRGPRPVSGTQPHEGTVRAERYPADG